MAYYIKRTGEGVDTNLPTWGKGREAGDEGKAYQQPILLHYNPSMPQSSMTPISQKLRRDATKEENQLWYQFLRSHPVGFRRQKGIGRYIVDFYCAKAKLVIELDGSQHFEEQNLANEARRESFLRDKGYKVVRFLNSDIWFHFSDVCRTIDEIVNPDNLDLFT